MKDVSGMQHDKAGGQKVEQHSCACATDEFQFVEHKLFGLVVLTNAEARNFRGIAMRHVVMAEISRIKLHTVEEELPIEALSSICPQEYMPSLAVKLIFFTHA